MIVKCLCGKHTDFNLILSEQLNLGNAVDSAIVTLPIDRMEHKCECGRIYWFSCFRMMQGDES